MKKHLLFLFICVPVLFSCVGKKMTAVKTRLTGIKGSQAVETSQVTGVYTSKEQKLAEGKIDSIINVRYVNRVGIIKKELDSVDREIAGIDSLLNSKKSFRKSYKEIVLPKLDQLDAYRNGYAGRMKVYLMLEDGLNVANYTLFDLAAFFGSGKYNIPEDSNQMALKAFMPLLDSVINFSNKYPDISKTATFVVLGFSDGIGINKDGPLYPVLQEKAGKQEMSDQELNQVLSELRATELINVLTVQFLKSTNTIKNFEKFHAEYLGKGKGEQYPLPTIRDYKQDDERRRIVLCYWAVVPD
jgi:hypothetical protein